MQNKTDSNEVDNILLIFALFPLSVYVGLLAFFCWWYSDYEHVSSSSEYHPDTFPYVQGFDIPKPDIPLVYGFPDHQVPNIHYNAPLQSSPNLPESSPLPTETNILLLDTPTTTTDASSSLLDNDSTTILTGDSLNVRKKRSFIHSQPKQIEITSTARPRTRYDDEGKWRIIRQEEDKQDKKYDYL